MTADRLHTWDFATMRGRLTLLDNTATFVHTVSGNAIDSDLIVENNLLEVAGSGVASSVGGVKAGECSMP